MHGKSRPPANARLGLNALSAVDKAKKRVEATRTEHRVSRDFHRAAGKASAGIPRPLPLAYFYRQARLPRAKHLAAVLADLRRERADQRKLQRQIARLTAPRPQARSSVSTSFPTPASSRL